MKNLITASLKVCFYFIKEKICRIKPKEQKYVFIVVETIGENNQEIIAVFEKEVRAKIFCIGITDYKILKQELL